MPTDYVRRVRLFQEQAFPPLEELFNQLKNGQVPKVLFITCSDSRLDPNLLTQSEPGELFVVRNAGNLIPPYGALNSGEVSGTVEFALSVLNIKEIIVCGHSHCGAMQGILNPEKVSKLPSTQKWLHNADNTQLIMRENYPSLTGEALLDKTIQINVIAQIDNLKTHPIVAAKLERGDLKIHAWIYEFETGKVFAYDWSLQAFKPLISNAAMHRPLTSKL